jgi:hypothetical protein
MRAILTDVNAQGHARVLLHILESEPWREFWAHLGLTMLTFRDLGLNQNATDAVLWHTCQSEQVILLTGNRNADGPDSLETTLRAHNSAESLPVFTVGNLGQLMKSREYAERVVEKLVGYLLDIDKYRGTGRLYLP